MIALSCRETENNNNPGYDPRNTPEEDLNQIYGGQAYERDPRLPTLPEETSDNGIEDSHFKLDIFSYLDEFRFSME
jgi:hypothetical protein